MSSDKDDINTLATTAAAVGGAVATSHLLYRPDSVKEKLPEVTTKLNEAADKVEAKIDDIVKEHGYTRYGQKLNENAAEAARNLEGAELAVKGLQGANKPRELNAAFRELNKAQKNHEKASKALLNGYREHIQPELAELEKQQALHKSLTKMESANAKEGIYAALKRPVDVLRHGSSKAKLAVLGGAAALGAIVYGIGKAISSERRSDSFADRIQQQQMEAALAAGAAPARS